MGRPISTNQLTALGIVFLLAAALLGTFGGGRGYSVVAQQMPAQEQHSAVFALNQDVSADGQHASHAHSEAATTGHAAGQYSHIVEVLGVTIIALVMLGSLAQRWLQR